MTSQISLGSNPIHPSRTSASSPGLGMRTETILPLHGRAMALKPPKVSESPQEIQRRKILSVLRRRRFSQFTQDQWAERTDEAPFFRTLNARLENAVKHWQSLNVPIQAYMLWGASFRKEEADVIDAYQLDNLLRLARDIKDVYKPGLRIDVLRAGPHMLADLSERQTKNYISKIIRMLEKHPNVFRVGDLDRYWKMNGLNIEAFRKLAKELRPVVKEKDFNPGRIVEMRERLINIARDEGLDFSRINGFFNPDNLQKRAEIFKDHREELMRQAEHNYADDDALLGAMIYFLMRPCENSALSSDERLKSMIPMVVHPVSTTYENGQPASSVFFHIYPEGTLSIFGVSGVRGISAPSWTLNAEGLARSGFVISDKTRRRLEKYLKA